LQICALSWKLEHCATHIYIYMSVKYIAHPWESILLAERANGKWVSIVPETASRLFSFGPSTQARKALCHNKNCNSEVGYVSVMEIKVKI
jgi:hypothetical protein